MLLLLQRARERLSDKGAFEELGFGGSGWGLTGGRSEYVYGFEHKVTRECAAKI